MERNIWVEIGTLGFFRRHVPEIFDENWAIKNECQIKIDSAIADENVRFIQCPSNKIFISVANNKIMIPMNVKTVYDTEKYIVCVSDSVIVDWLLIDISFIECHEHIFRRKDIRVDIGFIPKSTIRLFAKREVAGYEEIYNPPEPNKSYSVEELEIIGMINQESSIKTTPSLIFFPRDGGRCHAVAKYTAPTIFDMMVRELIENHYKS